MWCGPFVITSDLLTSAGALPPPLGFGAREGYDELKGGRMPEWTAMQADEVERLMSVFGLSPRGTWHPDVSDGMETVPWFFTGGQLLGPDVTLALSLTLALTLTLTPPR